MSYEQTIYNRLRKHGVTQAGALGILGNWACESGNEPFRVQGDFNAYRTISKAYVQDIKSNRMSAQMFQSDQKGFGLAQWTYWSRKAEMLQVCGRDRIDDAEAQTDFAVKEMKRDFPNLWQFLTQTTDVFTACSRVCREFERPAVNNIDARFAAAKRIQNEINLDGGSEPEPEPQPAPAPAPKPAINHNLKLRTIDCHCENFVEFGLLKAVIDCRGYMYVDVWDSVEQFQKDHGLTPDRVVGPMTWDKLLERTM
jgi:hypothetical protein